MKTQNSKLKTQNFFFQNGFSLMEVMTAIFIILIGLVGIMSLIASSFNAGSLSTSRLIAANLAQEGIEVVKNIRDLNYGTNGWDTWYASFPVGIAVTYSVQYNSQDFSLPPGNYLNYDSSSGLYSYAAATPSPFKRDIIITKAPPPNNDSNEIKVVSHVTWTERGVAHTLDVEDRLWNWR